MKSDIVSNFDIPQNVTYFGLLGNVNYSIQFIEFPNKLKVEKWPKSRIVELIAEMTDQSIFEIEGRFETIYGCGDKKSAYCITTQLLDPPKQNDETSVSYFLKRHEYQSAFIEEIEQRINLLRLCSKGDIRLSFSCFYTYDDQGKRELDALHDNFNELRNWKFHVSPNEIENFNDFISTTRFPLNHEYLQLAFETFLLSYEAHDDRLSFLALMIALETLFNDGNQELRYRLARGSAVFLGKSSRESHHIFNDIRKLYDKRSTLVHTGDSKKLSSSDLLLLQNYVRDSLRLLIQCNLPKKDLTNRLTVEGFGALNRIKKFGKIKQG